MSHEDTAWVVSKSEADFGTCTNADDYFHPPEINPPGASVTETYYFTFSIPEERINAIIYLWLHPNLGVLSGGLNIYQGFKSHYLASECFNWLDYLDTSHIDRQTGTVSLPNGLVMKVNKPFEEHELIFEDRYAETRFHLHQRAAMPAAVRGGNKHFEQAMKVDGELVLRGRKYKVDCFGVRDRSWGEHRSEDPMHVPPYTWLTLSGPGFAMNVASFDDMGQYPQRDSSIAMPPKLFTDGWVYRDGELTRIVECKRSTTRSDDQLVPQEHLIEAVDKLGRSYTLRGKAVASCPVVGWKNSIMHQTLVQWDVNGTPYWGESQDVHWTDFERQFRK